MAYDYDSNPYDELPEAESSRPGLMMILITLLVLLSLLGSLAWPLLRPRRHIQPAATPTPVFLLEA